ncbi:hypothetical protein JMUB6875_53960 [Nocardia sp. JMUB6875]|uniref:polyprenyl synthetase family protein n=1 Tax=Nocardia sp. JMUB6875 TaxID=3158170 RepID=UPI0032E69C1D
MSSSTAADPAFSRREGKRDSAIGPGDRARFLLRRAQRLTTPLMRVAVDTLPEELRVMAGYHLGWCTADGSATADRAGKGLRPALVLAAAVAAGGQARAALHAAAAVEMVHNFTLIHEDVMDGDTERRGRPTVWRLWGVDDAVLVGDALHSLAIWTLADAPAAALGAIARLEDAVIEVCLERDKGSALLSCACAVGALSAGAPAEVVAALDRFGRDLAHRQASVSIASGLPAADLLALADCVGARR